MKLHCSLAKTMALACLTALPLATQAAPKPRDGAKMAYSGSNPGKRSDKDKDDDNDKEDSKGRDKDKDKEKGKVKIVSSDITVNIPNAKVTISSDVNSSGVACGYSITHQGDVFGFVGNPKQGYRILPDYFALWIAEDGSTAGQYAPGGFISYVREKDSVYTVLNNDLLCMAKNGTHYEFRYENGNDPRGFYSVQNGLSALIIEPNLPSGTQSWTITAANSNGTLIIRYDDGISAYWATVKGGIVTNIPPIPTAERAYSHSILDDGTILSITGDGFSYATAWELKNGVYTRLNHPSDPLGLRSYSVLNGASLSNSRVLTGSYWTPTGYQQPYILGPKK